MMIRTATRATYALAVVLPTVIAVVACSDDGGTGPAGDEAAALAFVTQPTDATAGAANIVPAGAVALQGGSAPITASVEIQDASGDRVTSATNAVTMAIVTNAGGGTLTGTISQNAVNGIANFSVEIDKTGTGYTLSASAPGLTGVTSSAFDITADVPTQLVFRTQPSDATVRTPISPAIEVEAQDQFGNLATDATLDVTLSILTNPGTMLLNASGSRVPPNLDRVDPITLTVLPPLPNATAASTEVFGMTYWQPTNSVLATVADFSGGPVNIDLFSLNPGTGEATFIGKTGDNITGPFLRPVAVESGTGRLLAGDRFGNLLYVIESATAAPTLLGTVDISADEIERFLGLAVDPTTGTLWGLVNLISTFFVNIKIRVLVTIDVSSLTATYVSELDELGTSSIAFLPDGTLLGATGKGGTNPHQLWTVDPATGAMTSILQLPTRDGGQVIATVPAMINGNVEAVVNGVAVFSNVSVDGVGNGYDLEAMSGNLTSATSTTFNVSQ